MVLDLNLMHQIWPENENGANTGTAKGAQPQTVHSCNAHMSICPHTEGERERETERSLGVHAASVNSYLSIAKNQWIVS